VVGERVSAVAIARNPRSLSERAQPRRRPCRARSWPRWVVSPVILTTQAAWLFEHATLEVLPTVEGVPSREILKLAPITAACAPFRLVPAGGSIIIVVAFAPASPPIVVAVRSERHIGVIAEYVFSASKALVVSKSIF
jgi:hypothetical protein